MMVLLLDSILPSGVQMAPSSFAVGRYSDRNLDGVAGAWPDGHGPPLVAFVASPVDASRAGDGAVCDVQGVVPDGGVADAEVLTEVQLDGERVGAVVVAGRAGGADEFPQSAAGGGSRPGCW